MAGSLVMGCQAKNVICLDAQLGGPGGPTMVADVPRVHLDRTGECGARLGNQLSAYNVNSAMVADQIEGLRSFLHHYTMNMTEWDEEGLLAPLCGCCSNSRDRVYLQPS